MSATTLGALVRQLRETGYSPILTPVSEAQDHIAITGASMSPGTVSPGDLFVAISGARAHGADFVTEVLQRGAVAVLTDTAGLSKIRQVAGYQLPVIEVAAVRSAAGPAAAAIHATTASSDPALFGVTGTNGKTTTTYLLRALLAEVLRPRERQAGLIGTIEIAAGDQRIASEMTTPEAVELHALMSHFRSQNVAAAAMEVSSHAVSFQRISGLFYDVAGFTNLTQDHLDLHGDMEGYFAVKSELFRRERTMVSVITVDDAWGHRMAAEASGIVVTLSTSGAATIADWVVEEVVPYGLGSAFTLVHTRTQERIRTWVALPGAFNVSNAALAAVMVLESVRNPGRIQDFRREDVVRALETGNVFDVAVPGRMQVLSEHPTAIVDFAHNPDAMMRTLDAVRPETGKLILVIGAAGERDATKRPTMGAIAVRMADHVIVSDDDPHHEDPAQIRAGILEGARDAISSGLLETRLEEITPRSEAIFTAVAAASPEDTILIAGRGHESHQDLAGTAVTIDDRVELVAALRARGFSTFEVSTT